MVASHLPMLSFPYLVKMRKDLKMYLLPFTQACVYTPLHPQAASTKGESCKDAWNSSESSILFKAAKKQKRVLKLVMDWRQWFQECRKSPVGGFLCCVSSQPKPASVVALRFSCSLCNCSQHGQKNTLSMKHPASLELLPLEYYFASLTLYSLLIFLIYCYLHFL